LFGNLAEAGFDFRGFRSFRKRYANQGLECTLWVGQQNPGQFLD